MPSGHGSAWSACCTDSAAAMASGADAKAAQNASPPVLKTRPPREAIDWRSSASCRATASRIAAGRASHRRELCSMSVKRKVTVPAGNGGAGGERCVMGLDRARKRLAFILRPFGRASQP
jgi:hypothetical protein